MLVALTLVISAAFGAAMQYLGSLSAHPWATEVSLLSAPWLLLPLLAGCTQSTSRRGALLGLAVTVSGLAGYGLMTLSPVEGAHLSSHTAVAFLRSEALVFIGGAVTGPLFGWLGHRWRAERATTGLVIIAAAFCLEPVAHVVLQRGVMPSASVTAAELTIGMVAAATVPLLRRRGSVSVRPRRRCGA